MLSHRLPLELMECSCNSDNLSNSDLIVWALFSYLPRLGLEILMWNWCCIVWVQITWNCCFVWAYTTKLQSNGTLDRYKTRLVAQGYNREHGVDYKETFTPAAKMMTICNSVAVASVRDGVIHQMDVKNMFLNGVLKETIYVASWISGCWRSHMPFAKGHLWVESKPQGLSMRNACVC